jgi:6-phosphogluconate dehydrogenase (decarboxylating)
MMEVHVSSAGEADLALDRAVAVIAEAAKHHRTGVLVTRIGAGHYIVRAHPAVPYGLVRESMMAPKLGVGPDESNEILKQASIFLERELGPRGP